MSTPIITSVRTDSSGPIHRLLVVTTYLDPGPDDPVRQEVATVFKTAAAAEAAAQPFLAQVDAQARARADARREAEG